MAQRGAAEAISSAAHTFDIDLIVTTHDHGGIERAVVGIADNTLPHALGLPLLLLPPHDDADSLRNQLTAPS